MNTARTITRTVLVLLVASSVTHGQTSFERLNSHIGALVSFPLSPTNQYVRTGWGLAGGAGYNVTSHHSLIGEFMWNRLYATDRSLQPLREEMQSPQIGGKSNLYMLTGNYRYERRGKVLGTYFIAGGGLYYRTTNPSRQIDVGSNVPCAPAWIWWGFKCTSGTVTPESLGSVGSNALGGNGGLGLTARIGEEPYRMYIETRYHYASNRNVSTQMVTITVGVRY